MFENAFSSAGWIAVVRIVVAVFDERGEKQFMLLNKDLWHKSHASKSAVNSGNKNSCHDVLVVAAKIHGKSRAVSEEFGERRRCGDSADFR